MSKRQKKLSYLKDMDEIIHKVNEKMEKPKDLCEKDLKENRYSNVDEEVEEVKINLLKIEIIDFFQLFNFIISLNILCLAEK